MDTHETPPRRSRRGVIAAAVAALAVAVALPASGALAGGGDSADSSAADGTSSSGATQVQQQRPDSGEQRDRDCPEKDRGGQDDSGQQTNPDDQSQQL
jgi:hypothetical protein